MKRQKHRPTASTHGLFCPSCGSLHLRTLETRPTGGGVKRRRECETCGYRMTTIEAAVVRQVSRNRDKQS
ncbi:hypothetical protein [Pseudaminobacter salicylatoxidans]|uniref:NrdR family transcriptional regulator n=1 Tax=Pseudaminobacter salicylatoxidans TaxID=93369 RepID=UPI003CC83305